MLLIVTLGINFCINTREEEWVLLQHGIIAHRIKFMQKWYTKKYLNLQ
jgi:hypothetical protein